MSEFTLEDGRKAEKVEKAPDSLTKVTEVYVEPKPSKRLSQRITERFCVCEREIETIDEDTGEVVDRAVESLCGNSAPSADKSPMRMAVENKIKASSANGVVVFGVILAVQAAALIYVLFLM